MAGRSSSATACCGAIREEQATRAELRFWDQALLESGAAVREERHRLLAALAEPLAAAHAEIAPDEAAVEPPRLTLRDERPAAPRRVGPRRPRPPARRDGREGGLERVHARRARTATTSSSRWAAAPSPRSRRAGQQRTAILAFKLAELDLLTALDGRPPLLLLDDVFSELDPERRAHLVRRIAALPQAFVTTTTLDDIDPALRRVGTAWAVTAGR